MCGCDPRLRGLLRSVRGKIAPAGAGGCVRKLGKLRGISCGCHPPEASVPGLKSITRGREQFHAQTQSGTSGRSRTCRHPGCCARVRATHQAHHLYGDRERPARPVQAGDRGRGAGRRDRLGARLHRRHHGALPCREGQSARRRGARPRRHQPDRCSRRWACSRPTSRRARPRSSPCSATPPRPTPGPAWTPISRCCASTPPKARRTTSRRRRRGRTSPSPNTRARS